MINLLDLSRMELVELVKDLGEKPFRAQQIYNWIYGKKVDGIDEMRNLPSSLRELLKSKCTVRHLKIVKMLTDDKSQTWKFLLSLADENTVECVLMKYKHGYTLCISTQVGCKMGCRFCASTIDGLARNLSSGEIIDQIIVVEKSLGIRVSNIVLMGSGEPLDNYDNVLKFIYNVNDSMGLNIGQRHITLSTCGIVPKMLDLAKEQLQINLSISLHAPNNSIRDKIMPINRKYPVEELLKAAQFYWKKTGRRITFEYALIKDMNDSLECARQLYELVRGLNCLINLIPVNEINESGFIKSEKDNIIRFSNYLKDKSITVTIRRELGSSINAACGQLRRSVKRGH